ncbi:uncharacterized protein isoform X1 [Salmo salar]|uniref:Uncharacterized protein isoform X1 n=2 Tax=Salmo salar TaxID=8030 RepID=A0A1S3QYU2_SALSA|nr:uncharacterized protein LOC106598790 isoform X1 [Salmo salar]
MFLSACGVYSTSSQSAEEAKKGKIEGKGQVSCFPSSDPTEGTQIGSHTLETMTYSSHSLKSRKLSAVQSNTRLEKLVPHSFKNRKKHKLKMEPSIVSAPVLPSVAISNHGLEPDSECIAPTDNTQANLRSDLKQISVSHTCSDLPLSQSPSMHSPCPPSTVHINRQPLPVTHASYLCCSPVAQVHDPSLTTTAAPIRATKHRQRRKRGLKHNRKGVSPLSMRHKRQSRRRCNIQFWCQVWRKWGHRKWRRARCLLWFSMIRAKRLAETSRRLSIFNTQMSYKYTGELAESQKWQKVRKGKEVVTTAIACDGQGLDSAEDSQAKGSLEQKVRPSVGTSVLCSNPVKEEDQGIVRARDAATATKQDTLVTKRAVPYQPQSQRASTDVSWEATTTLIHEFLDCFYVKYGSFIPLSKSDVLRHLNKKLNTDLTKRKYLISAVVMKYQAVLAHRMMPAFRVVYNKHTLTLEDLSTLDDQNWLNDQVMNMYGELIMESAQHKVHFFNSFFHRQLMTKGYEGVKRWTKKVDLFSKALLLIPIHLEIHWCLVTADTAGKRIHLYDSQGIVFKEAAENVLRYIHTEAKERKQTAFQNGWKMYINERIPQQTNENDCGVFVLEYCRCLALGKPLQFSQGDMPTVRKRIYRELCECKLQD